MVQAQIRQRIQKTQNQSQHPLLRSSNLTMALLRFSLLTLMVSLRLLVGAETVDTSIRPISLEIAPQDSESSHKERDLQLQTRATCRGSCEYCFGSGYTLCPSSTITCYKPGDSNYGLESCPYGSGGGSSGSATTTRASVISSAVSSATGADYTIPSLCSNGGSNCASCFGSGYIPCDGDPKNCHKPSDPDSVCPGQGSGSSSGSGSVSGSGSGSNGDGCSRTYGSSYVPCGNSDCYAPSLGETCCQDGSKAQRSAHRLTIF